MKEGNIMPVLFCLATSLEVAGSILNGGFGIFHSHNPSSRTMTLGSTQPLAVISTTFISRGVKEFRA